MQIIIGWQWVVLLLQQYNKDRLAVIGGAGAHRVRPMWQVLRMAANPCNNNGEIFATCAYQIDCAQSQPAAGRHRSGAVKAKKDYSNNYDAYEEQEYDMVADTTNRLYEAALSNFELAKYNYRVAKAMTKEMEMEY
eukprot:100940_1